MSSASGLLILQARAHGEPWSTLNTRTYDSAEGFTNCARELREFSDRWSVQSFMAGHEFRVIDTTNGRRIRER